MAYYCNRINAAGWRPERFFPLGIVRGIDLAGASLVFPISSEEDFNYPVIAQYSNISDVKFIQVSMAKSDFSFTYAKRVQFLGSLIFVTNFAGADLEGAEFHACYLNRPNFKGASLKNATFSDSTLDVFVPQQLEGAILEGAHLNAEEQ
jgi:uncharacterized protein YjbI with pentapeptide repeats